MLLRFWGAKRMREASRPAYFRPCVEAIEDRIVLSAAALAPPALAPALVAPAQAAASLVPLTITGVSLQNGVPVATGLLGSQAFTTPLAITTSPGATATATPILDLHLAPIHLDLLGLTVDTSEICLKVTAYGGPGNLLGNLLTDVANLLNTGTPLAGLLGGTAGIPTNLVSTGVSDLLSAALSDVTARPNVSSATTAPTGNVLHLSLGPVNLNLLGLGVTLDNCSGGPITVDVSAVPGAGNLLGNLISGLSHLLDGPGLHTGPVNNILNQLTSEIATLAGPVTSLLPLQLSGVAVQNGALVATGTLGGQTFTAPITLTTSTASPAGAAATAAAAATPILNLHLGPIHLNLLGLTVDTSEICLSVAAQPGSGNLLGNLLTDVAGLLNNGTSLSGILGGLSAANLSTLTTGLTGLFNGALGALESQAANPSASGNVLTLSLGPVNLNLLGLLVNLDNCAGGPVTLAVSAVPGPGNLLGNLVSDLTHLLDHNPLNAVGINNLLGQITTTIDQLVGAV